MADNHDYHWFTEEIKRQLDMMPQTTSIRRKEKDIFNLWDVVETRYGKGVITHVLMEETGKSLYRVALCDGITTFDARDADMVLIDDRRGEVDMAGIINNKIEKKEVTNEKNTYVYHNCPDLYHTLQMDYANINRYPVGSYQDALEDAKKRLNSMYGIGHSILPTVLRSDFARFLNEVKDIKFSGRATIVFWKDGTKTVVKCQEGEHYDPKDGIEYALFKKIAGGTSNQASKMAKKYDEWLEKWIPEDLKSGTVEQSENEENGSPGSESTITKATEETLNSVLNEDANVYVVEEMKKRLIGMGKGIREMADTMHSLNEKLKDYLNDKPEETEKK